MGQAKRRGSFEERLQQAQADQIACDLLIIKHDTRHPMLEFQHGVVHLKEQSRVDRSAAINGLHNNWGHDSTYLGIAGEYLTHSPSLQMARQGFIPEVIWDPNTGRQQHIDLQNLGCVIEFTLEGEAITTDGPQWCTPEEVHKKAAELRQQNQHTHSIRTPA